MRYETKLYKMIIEGAGELEGSTSDIIEKAQELGLSFKFMTFGCTTIDYMGTAIAYRINN